MRKLVVLLSTLFLTAHANAQSRFPDSLRVQVGSQVQVASEAFQPLWAKANRFGMASDRQFDQITWIEATNAHYLTGLKLLSDSVSPLTLDYGATAFNSEHYSRLVLQQAYAQLRYKSWFLRAGRHRDLWDDLDPQLSMGSLGTSGNALPIPKITIGIDDYIKIPYTKGILEFKGMMGHGWFGTNRYMDSWLHEKSFYARINLGKWKPYGGIQHYAEWGGQRPSENIYLDRSFRGFLDVFFVREANDGSLPTELEENGKRPNRAGTQRGLAELGVYYDHDAYSLHFYNQTPIESGTGIDIRNIDRLIGIHFRNKRSDHVVQDLVVEFIHTKQMESFGKEMQSYYNNGAMKTGWEYERQVIGNPLYTNREDASNYLPIEPFDWRSTDFIPGNNNIVNNRLVGGNIAGIFRVANSWNALAKITPVMNYGARNYAQYYGNENGLFQCYSLVGVSHDWGAWQWNANLAADFGKLYQNIGGSIGVKYQIR
ncbi:capsule assembly Wzi family protein [Sphingobacterium sp. lm-10]|uniref:capsule assembly Wzi family protein n=1 Tax=Sphingobacterium sp. lm-10 TaxID=2944904 RepID=UPI0020216F6D|nr:capsule assembly Wzi family protein [Sphingobacterium sp. lm-10]MCL7988657.1 capsule assembly Wzi family protein [Sphingobacterium sp. lm-10]